MINIINKMFYPLIQNIHYQDPLRIFAHFSRQNGAVFLDSAQLRESCGRYSFIAIDPFATLMSKNNVIEFNGKLFSGDLFQWLAENLAKYDCHFHPNLPPFQGGVAGFFSYDLYRHLENIPAHVVDDMQFPDMALGFYDLIIAFDNILQRGWIFSSGFPLLDKLTREQRAKKRLAWLIKELAELSELPATLSNAVVENNDIESNFTSQTYQIAVQKVIDYILAGDIFEANISQRFKTFLPKGLTPFDLYRRLRLFNPAPFAAYVNFNETVIVSASPERFIKLHHGQVETRPIKGTRMRGKTEIEDHRLAAELLNSSKDHAENVMIVDLLRNDISRVCEDHSVKVPQLCALESYATVHHLVSVVTGQLQSSFSAIDLLKATFPGGSITGAPKIRSMEIIAEIEPNTRGPYCGSVGYIGFNGDMDSSIVIRTYAIKNNCVTFQAGGAVVADSNPEAEYEETLIKASALRRALTDDFIN